MSLLLGSSQAGWAQSGSALPVDTAAVAAVIELARLVAGEDGGRLWGRSLAGPLLIAEPRSRAAWAGEPDGEGRLTKVGSLYRGVLSSEVNPANTALTWAGRRWTMVVWPLPVGQEDRRELLAHELWHWIQDSLGLPANAPKNGHLDEEMGRVWLRLELRALNRALQASGRDRGIALSDALGFRAARHQLYSGVDTSESALERNEGLAQYTGVRLSGRSLAGQRERVARRLLRLELEETVGRSFAYATGSAYGLLLDELLPDWKSHLEQGVSPAALAGAALQPGGPRATTAPAGARYGEAVIRSEERTRAARRAARRAELVARFVTGPILRIPLQAVSIGFDPGAVESLDSLGSVYRSARLSDAWGVLDAGAGAARINAGWTEASVPIGPAFDGSVLAGPGWRLELAKGWRAIRAERGTWRLEPAP